MAEPTFALNCHFVYTLCPHRVTCEGGMALPVEGRGYGLSEGAQSSLRRAEAKVMVQGGFSLFPESPLDIEPWLVFDLGS